LPATIRSQVEAALRAGRTPREIAAEYGVARVTAQRAAHRIGISLGKRLSEIERREIQDSTMSPRELALRYGITHERVRQLRKAAEVSA